MKSIIGALLVFLAGFTIAEPSIEPLRKSDIDYGCGCDFHVPPDQEHRGATILQWVDGSPANLRADGELRKLIVTAREPAESSITQERVGDRAIFDLAGQGISASAVCTAIKVCEPDNDSCEVTIYRAKVSIRTPAGTKVLDTWASCGC